MGPEDIPAYSDLSRCGSLLRSSHRWWIPLPIDCLSPGEVEAHGQVERTRRRREPVRLVGGAGVLVLDVQVKRAAFVVSQWVAVAEGEAVKRVATWKPSWSYIVTDQKASTGGSSCLSKCRT